MCAVGLWKSCVLGPARLEYHTGIKDPYGVSRNCMMSIGKYTPSLIDLAPTIWQRRNFNLEIF